MYTPQLDEPFSSWAVAHLQVSHLLEGPHSLPADPKYQYTVGNKMFMTDTFKGFK